MADPKPRRPAGLPRARATSRSGSLRQSLRGPWRVVVREHSMAPAIAPGDWLLVDPTVRRWPRRGSVVVFREPFGDVLAIKRVVGRPGDWIPFEGGRLRLDTDEAWLVGDATDEAAAAAGEGPPGDSRRYGPVPVDRLLGRGGVRYPPFRRVGRVP